MSKNFSLVVQGHTIGISQINEVDYISLTDIAKSMGDDTLIYSWMRNRNTVEYLGAWEALNNPDFKGDEFVTFQKSAGLNSFNLTPQKWITATNSIGIRSKSGKGGGTFAHKEIAMEFCRWVSPTFSLYINKEYDRLKSLESNSLNVDWNIKRVMSKTNYHIHTAAIKEHRIPVENLPKEKEGVIYADEAEILNYAVFGFSAKSWKEENQDLVLRGMNLRDVASINQLLVLSNMESINSVMLASGMAREDRKRELRAIAQQQLRAINKVDVEKSYKKTVEGGFENPASLDTPLSSYNQTLKQALNYNPKKDDAPE